MAAAFPAVVSGWVQTPRGFEGSTESRPTAIGRASAFLALGVHVRRFGFRVVRVFRGSHLLFPG